jgi:transposase
MTYHKLNLNNKLIWELYYEKNLSADKIADQFNCSRGTIFNRLKEMGRKKKWKNPNQKSYQNYFRNISKPEQAWILGWIVSDGHIKKSQNSVSFMINLKDVQVLERIAQEIGENSVRVYKDNNRCQFAFGNEILVNDLVKLGIPRGKKSNIVKPLKLSKELMPHFWRGVWEGDGSIGVWKCGRIFSPSIELSGNENMCNAFSKEVLRRGSISKSKNYNYRAKTSTLINQYWQNLFNYFYDDYTLEKHLFLDRKYKNFVKVIEYVDRNL